MSHIKKPAVTSAPVHELIGGRWSPRAFAATPVAREAVVSILEAGRWAASTNNSQPWRFIVTTSHDPAAHGEALACFAPGNQRWAAGAPVYVIALARKAFEANGNPNGHSWHDTGAAGTQMVLQANALGLVVHAAGGIDRDKIRQTYSVPEGYDICCAYAVGYQGDAGSLPDDLAERERAPRARKSLEELVVGPGFGAAASVLK